MDERIPGRTSRGGRANEQKDTARYRTWFVWPVVCSYTKEDAAGDEVDATLATIDMSSSRIVARLGMDAFYD